MSLAETRHAADASGKAWGDALQRVRQMEESQVKNNSTKPSEAAVDIARDKKTEHDRTEPIQRKCYNNYKQIALRRELLTSQNNSKSAHKITKEKLQAHRCIEDIDGLG